MRSLAIAVILLVPSFAVAAEDCNEATLSRLHQAIAGTADAKVRDSAAAAIAMAELARRRQQLKGCKAYLRFVTRSLQTQ